MMKTFKKYKVECLNVRFHKEILCNSKEESEEIAKVFKKYCYDIMIYELNENGLWVKISSDLANSRGFFSY